jgi:steroid 5-alpha reductase family enzyme
MDIFKLFFYPHIHFVDNPLLISIPITILYYLYNKKPDTIIYYALIIWILYFVYEIIMHEQMKNTVGAPIRIDLLLAAPIMNTLFVYSVFKNICHII